MGRKKTDDPKIRIDLWVHTTIVEKNGGKLKAQEKAKKYLELEAEAARESKEKK